jgi:hypothetical protein
VHFYDIARGGLRVVYPGSKVAHALERAAIERGVQPGVRAAVKNKDILEGGP